MLRLESPTEVGQERIRAAFSSDRGLGAMAGKHAHVVGQVEHPSPHRFDELGIRATRKVGAPDRPGEELIAREQHRLVNDFDADVARRVSWSVSHTQAESGEIKDLIIGQRERVDRGPEIAWRTHAEQHPQLGVDAHGEKVVIRMNPCLHGTRLLNGRGAVCVIDMAVGDDETGQGQAVPVRQFQDRGWIGGSVDHHRSLSWRSSQYPAVGLREPQCDVVDQHAGRSLGRTDYSSGSVNNAPMEMVLPLWRK